MNQFSKEDLVRFGNYLLSQERKDRTSKINRGNVTHADIYNFADSVGIEIVEDIIVE